MRTISHFDAPFWILIMIAATFAGSLGCFGLAAAAQHPARPDGVVAP